MTDYRDAQVVGLQLVREMLAASVNDSGEAYDAAVARAVAAVGADGVDDLVALLASNVMAMALMLDPHDPDRALDQLEGLTTLTRLDFDEDKT